MLMRAVSGLVDDHGSQEKIFDHGSVTATWMYCSTLVSPLTLQGPELVVDVLSVQV